MLANLCIAEFLVMMPDRLHAVKETATEASFMRTERVQFWILRLGIEKE